MSVLAPHCPRGLRKLERVAERLDLGLRQASLDEVSSRDRETLTLQHCPAGALYLGIYGRNALSRMNLRCLDRSMVVLDGSHQLPAHREDVRPM